MTLKNHKWLLMPICLVLGLGMLFGFVSYSQGYLSGYLNENSKDVVGKSIDLKNLAAHLQDERITEFAQKTENPTFGLIFWSVTCAPCLNDLAQLKLPQGDTLLVPINTDGPSQMEEAHAIFSKIVKNDYPFLHDANQYLEKQFKIKYLPTHVYIDKAGTIIKHEVGEKPF